jgi:hypothetical protein
VFLPVDLVMLTTMDGVLKVMSVTAITNATVLSMWGAMPDGMDRVPTVSVLAADLGFSRYRLSTIKKKSRTYKK